MAAQTNCRYLMGIPNAADPFRNGIFIVCHNIFPHLGYPSFIVVVACITHQYYAMTPVAALAQDSSLLWGLGPEPGWLGWC